MVIAGQIYTTVWLAPDAPRPPGMGEDDEGYCDYGTGTIYVVLSPSLTRNHCTRVHEIVHAALEASGAGWLLSQLAQKAGRDADEVEEEFVRMLAPALTGVCNGF